MNEHTKVDPEDPRLTAYALGELDEHERAEVEALIAGDDQARAAVDEARDLGRMLADELGHEPGSSGLTDEQRAEIERAATRKPMVTLAPVGRRRRWPLWSAASVAALLLGLLTVQVLQNRSDGVAPFAYDIGFGCPSSSDARYFPNQSRLERKEPLRALGYLGGDEGASEPPPLKYPPLALSPQEAASPGLKQGQSLIPPLPAEAQSLEVGSEGVFTLSDFDVEIAQAASIADFDTEAYALIVENPFYLVTQEPLSTFSIDVDTASYANVRRFLRRGQLPPPDSVRIEELINYFSYDYPAPTGADPFSITAEVAGCPWNPEHRLVHVGLKGVEIPAADRPPSNLVFLLDVSGSMRSPDKLDLVKRGMRLLVDNLTENDSVAIAVYAGSSGLVLPATQAYAKEAILEAIERLEAGGSTNGGEGIRLAYGVARQQFIRGGNNRVILCTDGDFNVGTTSDDALVELIQGEAKSGVFLSVLGFGTGNLKDSKLEQLADEGNGNYAYVDDLAEARKVLVEEMGSTLFTIAKDVKIQVEFNPAEVRAFRLIGYENRILEHTDFNDDTVDAGEIGAGHTVTALYEVVPTGVEGDLPGVDPLRYQRQLETTAAARSGELLTLKLRYKRPDGDESKLISLPVVDRNAPFWQASEDLRFSAAVAGFGMLLRNSRYKGGLSWDTVLELGDSGRGADRSGRRAAFLELVRLARGLQPR